MPARGKRSAVAFVAAANTCLLLLSAPAFATVVAQESIVVPAGATAVSEWVHVPAGRSVHWISESEGYMNHIAEVRGAGDVWGDDGGGFGWHCMAADQDLDFRLRFENTRFLARDSAVNYTIELLPSSPGECMRSTQAVEQAGGGSGGSGITEYGMGSLLAGVMIAVFVGAVVAGFVVGAVVILGERRKGREPGEGK